MSATEEYKGDVVSSAQAFKSKAAGEWGAETYSGQDGQISQKFPLGKRTEEDLSRPSAPKSEFERLKEFGASVTTGTLTGLATPEILMGGGRAIGMIPYPAAKAAGAAMETTGRIMKGSRAAQAGYGALAGAGSDIAKQTMEYRGAGPVSTTVAEFAAGGFAPEIAPMVNVAFQKAVSGITGIASRKDIGTMINSVVKSIEGDVGKPLTAEQRKFIEGKVNEIRLGKRNLAEPAQRTMETIQAGTQADIQAAERQAQTLRDQSKIEALKREQGLKETESERLRIGRPRESADIGEELRKPITERQTQLSEARQKQFDKDNSIVQNEVAGKEAKGAFLENDPASKAKYNEILTKLRNKLLIGKQAMTQKAAPVTESGVYSQLNRVYDSLKRFRKEVGVDEFGNPNYKEFPVSFNAIDDVRRKLGEAAFGKEAEGYEAIGAANARELYKDLSELQGLYSTAKRDLIANYEQASQDLNVFKTRPGKKAVETEKFDKERFKTDPSSLPKTYFRTRQSVRDLVELTGSPAKVGELASSYVAKEIEGKSATQVKNFIRDNEWLSEFPDLRYKLSSYQANLAKAEGLPIAEDVLKKAEAEATKITTEAQKRVDDIMSSKNPVARVEDFIKSEKSIALQTTVAPYLIRSPQGREVFTQAVRNVLADQSPNTMAKVFSDRIRPALEASNIVPQAEIDRLAGLVEQIDRSYQGTEKASRIVKIVNQAIQGTLAANTTGATAPVYGGIAGFFNPFKNLR